MGLLHSVGDTNSSYGWHISIAVSGVGNEIAGRYLTLALGQEYYRDSTKCFFLSLILEQHAYVEGVIQIFKLGTSDVLVSLAL